MLKEKLVIERKAATLITVDFTAPEIVGYAMAWLKLCNVARELKRIWKIENDRSNKVYVWCDPHYKDEMIDFLTGIVYFHKDGKPIPIGKVLDACDDTIGVPVYEYESTCDSNDEQWYEDIDYAISNWTAIQEVFD